MLLADIFSGPDAAIIITAIIGVCVPASLGIFKLLFSQKSNQSDNAFRDSIYEKINGLTVEIAEVRFKAIAVWDVFFKQAMNGVVSTGSGTLNSPLHINEQARQWLKPMENELREWFSKNQEMDERSQLISLERAFGTRLLEEVCVPNKLIYGVCLLIAFSVASDRSRLDLPFLNEPIPSSPEK